MEFRIPETFAERQANYLASAAEADKKAAQCKDEQARETWLEIANNYRGLAANLVLNFKL
jgi:hypothetical protein